VIERDDAALGASLKHVLARIQGAQPHPALPLDLQATGFQRQVWEMLQTIPRGSTRSYAQIAAAIGKPRASRAVARACASNRVALLVPCHRVVRKDGELGGYRWGADRKQAILDAERSAAHR
jgi:AraC family transcriptional regulator of adaptative response/methylated-DNA-[protein]-cysteine methyltransferase